MATSRTPGRPPITRRHPAERLRAVSEPSSGQERPAP